MSKSMVERVIEVDKRWSVYIHSLRVPRVFLKALEISGDGLLWIPVTAALWLAPFSSPAIPKIRAVVILIMVWSIATSTSRILLGRHYVLDVMAGGFLGILEAFVVHNLLSVSERVSEMSHLWVVGNACRHQTYLPYSFCRDLNAGI
ncbi:hypothetical protein SUGI_0227140 [Cryptomeria japonica]|nr:hypothetical protein SUGI_0227140 [Cryptomeria japonica]